MQPAEPDRCMRCLKRKSERIYITRRYRLQFCEKCDRPEYASWTEEDWEENISFLAASLPLEGEELLYNRLSPVRTGMDPGQWLDWQRGRLPEEDLHRCGLPAPADQAAREDRFPKCRHVHRLIFTSFRSSDLAMCPLGETGTCGGVPTKTGPCACLDCPYFEPRGRRDMRTVLLDDTKIRLSLAEDNIRSWRRRAAEELTS